MLLAVPGKIWPLQQSIDLMSDHTKVSTEDVDPKMAVEDLDLQPESGPNPGLGKTVWIEEPFL